MKQIYYFIMLSFILSACQQAPSIKPTSTPSSTDTPTITATSTLIPTFTLIPTNTASPTITDTPTITPTSSPTLTAGSGKINVYCGSYKSGDSIGNFEYDLKSREYTRNPAYDGSNQSSDTIQLIAIGASKELINFLFTNFPEDIFESGSLTQMLAASSDGNTLLINLLQSV